MAPNLFKKNLRVLGQSAIQTKATKGETMEKKLCPIAESATQHSREEQTDVEAQENRTAGKDTRGGSLANCSRQSKCGKGGKGRIKKS